jgi:hypothetical protein
MSSKLAILIAALAALLGSAIATVNGQGQSPGRWQMVVGNGGDGAAAWKYNIDTGQSFFCYRQNCFASALASAPARQLARPGGNVTGFTQAKSLER